ncbi:MAG TPA: GntR family transcriptional regulator, partial [Streptosporangiales bacterium]
MAVEWSGSGPDVLVSLDRDSTVPLRAQLEDQFRRAIRTGRLGHDERVPSSRVLATTLGVSRGLVQDCYAQLQAEGYLVTREGSATRVASAATRVEPVRRHPPGTRPRLVADFACGVP